MSDTPQKTGDGQDKQPPTTISDETRRSLMMQMTLSQQRHTAERANPTALDLVGEVTYSAIYSGLQSPIVSTGQIADKFLQKADIKSNIADAVNVMPAPEHEQFGTARWHAQQVGGAVGMILPFMATKGALSKSGLSFAARTEASALAGSRLLSTANAALIADGAAAGFAYDFLLRPVEQQDMDKFWTARTKHGFTGAATFGTLTAGSVTLRHLSRPLAASLAEAPKSLRVASDAVHGALPGIPAGIVSADVNSLLTKGKLATGRERYEGAYTMTFAGGALGALHAIPGSNVPIGDVARAYASQRQGQANLESMLAARARATKVEVKPASTAGDGSVPVARADAGMLGTPKVSTGRGVLSAFLQPGRAMAGIDVERPGGWKPEPKLETEKPAPKVETERPVEQAKTTERPAEKTEAAPTEKVAGPVEMQIAVPKGLEGALVRGVELAFKASATECTPAQVSEFFSFARSPEGQALKGSMSEVAKQYADDPRMMTIIREAYMPPEGIQHRVVEGNLKLTTNNATVDQHQRFAGFLNIVREMPQTVEGYVNFRHDVFRWLNENRDLHDWVLQYGQQNRHSQIAGPLDFYFQTSNMARFVDVAEGRIAPNVAAKVAEKAPLNEGTDSPIRLDLTREQAREGAANSAKLNDGLSLLGDANIRGIASGARPLVEIEGVVKTEGTRTEAVRPRVETKTEVSPESARAAMEQRMNAFEKSGPARKRIEAMMLADRFGEMTTEQFARWLDHAYAKPEGATNPNATNLRSMLIGGRDALLSPQVAEAYKAYRGFGEKPAEGQPQPPSLEAIRQFLGQPKTNEVPEMSEWAKFYVEARLEQAQQNAKPDARPHEILDAALPRWYAEGLKGQYVTDARFAGDAPTYSNKIPVELAQAMEAARLSRPPKQPRADGKPEREFKPPTNDIGFRLAKLEEVMKVEDPTIRENLLRLGAQDHTSLRSILGKLDPERAAPEYKELMQLVLPTTKNVGDVKIMLDSIFFGNKNHRNDAGSELTKSHQQLAMAVAENLVPQGHPKFDRTQQIVADMISGKIRDPRPPRDFDGGRGPGGPGGRDGGRDGGRSFNRDGAGPKPVEGDKAVAQPVQQPVPPVKVLAEPPRRPAVVEKTEPAEQPVVVEKPAVVEQPVVEKPPVVEQPVVVEKPAVVEQQVVEKPPVVEKPTVVEEAAKPESMARDVSTLKNGQKVKVEGKDAVFIAADPHTGDVVVRSGKPTQPQELFQNQKQFNKLKLHQVGKDSGTNRMIFRDNDGAFFEVRPHASGYMISARSEYRGVNPSDVQ